MLVAIHNTMSDSWVQLVDRPSSGTNDYYYVEGLPARYIEQRYMYGLIKQGTWSKWSRTLNPVVWGLLVALPLAVLITSVALARYYSAWWWLLVVVDGLVLSIAALALWQDYKIHREITDLKTAEEIHVVPLNKEFLRGIERLIETKLDDNSKRSFEAKRCVGTVESDHLHPESDSIARVLDQAGHKLIMLAFSQLNDEREAWLDDDLRRQVFVLLYAYIERKIQRVSEIREAEMVQYRIKIAEQKRAEADARMQRAVALEDKRQQSLDLFVEVFDGSL